MIEEIAKTLFVDYASRCTDMDKVAEIILDVNQKDDYGIRDTLIDCARECLPEKVIRRMISTLQERANKENENYERHHHLLLIESLARQIKDAKLFEKTRIASCGNYSTAAFIDIARVYLESGDVEEAQTWLCKIPKNETFKAYERDELLLEIYQKQGDTEQLSELLYQKFKSYHSIDTLQSLLNVIGHDKRDKVINKEVAQILNTDRFQESDAEFLLTIGKIDEADTYILNHAEQLNGDHYGRLIPLAEMMEFENRPLAVSLIYRSLLVSILQRGYTKAYSHGIRYLKKLDKLSVIIDDWKNHSPHEEFKEEIIQAHGRKRSFWSKYDGKK